MSSADQFDRTKAYYIRTATGQRFGPGDLATLVQWAREQRLPRDAVLIAVDDVESQWPIDAESVPELAAILNAPPMVAMPHMVGSNTTDAPGIVPYSNQPALIGYYFGVFALIPGVGIVLGVIAIWLGIRGIRKWQSEPRAKGLTHSIVAIVLGVAGPLLWVGVFWLMMNS